jgi:hypothetical protein
MARPSNSGKPLKPTDTVMRRKIANPYHPVITVTTLMDSR